MMKFVWEVSEKDWKEYPELIRKSADTDGYINTAGCVGCVRVGDLVFDLRAWGEYEGKCGLGYELFVGGVDNYAYTSSGYPYDLVEEYDEFPIDVIDMELEDFERMAEPILEAFIIDVATRYKMADLISKANEPTNYAL